MDTTGFDDVLAEDVPAAFGSAIGGGFFHVECYDKDGNLKWVDDCHNAVCGAALDDVNNVYFRNTTRTTTWYMGLVDNSGFTTFAFADTSASHAGWTEATGYSGGVRGTWAPGASSSQAITNGTAVSFTASGTATIRGLFISSDNTLGGTTGLLFSTAALSGGNQTINSTDVLKATYTWTWTAGA